MKRNAMFLGLMVVSTIVFSQGKVDPAERAARQSERMKKELALDDVQSKSIAAINEEHAIKRAEVFRDSGLSQEAKREKLKSLHQEKEAAVKKVLTDEQRQKLVAQRKQQTNMHRTKARGKHGDRATLMQKDLSLTDDQTSKIKAIDKEFGEKFRSLRNDSTVAKEDFRTHAKALREQHREQTKSVLTKEQYEKWESQMELRRKKRS